MGLILVLTGYLGESLIGTWGKGGCKSGTLMRCESKNDVDSCMYCTMKSSYNMRQRWERPNAEGKKVDAIDSTGSISSKRWDQYLGGSDESKIENWMRIGRGQINHDNTPLIN